MKIEIKKWALALMIFILGWELLSFLINNPVFPSLCSVILQSNSQMWSDILFHGTVSLSRVFAGILLGGLLGFLLGLLTSYKPIFDYILSPLVYLTYPFPKVVLVPILFILVGIGELSKILLIAIVMFYQIFLITRDTAKELDPRYLDAFKTLSKSPFQLYKHVYIPVCIPKIITGLKISFGSAFALLFFSETYATNQGLGYYVWMGFSRFDYLEVYAGSLGFCVMGFLVYFSMEQLEKFLPN